MAMTRYLGFRIPTEEMSIIEESAAAAGETVSEYVRTAILLRQGRKIITLTELAKRVEQLEQIIYGKDGVN